MALSRCQYNLTLIKCRCEFTDTAKVCNELTNIFFVDNLGGPIQSVVSPEKNR